MPEGSDDPDSKKVAAPPSLGGGNRHVLAGRDRHIWTCVHSASAISQDADSTRMHTTSDYIPSPQRTQYRTHSTASGDVVKTTERRLASGYIVTRERTRLIVLAAPTRASVSCKLQAVLYSSHTLSRLHRKAAASRTPTLYALSKFE